MSMMSMFGKPLNAIKSTFSDLSSAHSMMMNVGGGSRGRMGALEAGARMAGQGAKMGWDMTPGRAKLAVGGGALAGAGYGAYDRKTSVLGGAGMGALAGAGAYGAIRGAGPAWRGAKGMWGG